MSIANNMLIAPTPSTIVVTKLVPKADKQGMYQVFGHRVGDLRTRLVTFWVYRKEAEEIAQGCTALQPNEDFIAEIDAKAWAFVHEPAGSAA